MQSIYNQEILDKIKAVYPIELKNFIGWSNEDIEFLEKQIYPSQLPQAVKDFLLWAGNKFDNLDFIYYLNNFVVKDFYHPKPEFIRMEIEKNLHLELCDYVVFFYYIEGDFISFCKIENNNPNPPVYKTDYELEDANIFALCSPSFTQFIADLAISELKRKEEM